MVIKLENFKIEDLIIINNLDSGQSRKFFAYIPEDNKKYLVKFNKFKDSLDSISEYVACNILNKLNFQAQNTKLVTINNELVVLCEYLGDIIQLLDVSTYLNEDGSLDFQSLLELEKTNKNLVDKETFRNKIIELTYLSYIFNNTDLHPGNIGFIKEQNRYVFSKIYDFGSSLGYKYINNKQKLSKELMKLNKTIKIFHKKVNIEEFSKDFKIPNTILNIDMNIDISDLKESIPKEYEYFINIAMESIKMKVNYLKSISKQNSILEWS